MYAYTYSILYYIITCFMEYRVYYYTSAVVCLWNVSSNILYNSFSSLFIYEILL